ncbi:MAG: hypothetical protein ACRD6X_02630 [Pyrinomonadaceae bacterium]
MASSVEIWEKILASGIAAAIISIIVSLINRGRAANKLKSLTYEQIATDYELWEKYAQGSAWFGNDYLTKEKFSELSIEEKIEKLNQKLGPRPSANETD